MVLLLRVVRGAAWVAAPPEYSELLTLVRGHGAKHVSHGTLEPAADGGERTKKKRWAMAPFKGTGESERAVMRLSDSEREVELELSLFGVVGSKRVAWLARAALSLKGDDVAAVKAAKRVVFTTPFDGGLGYVEVTIAVEDESGSSSVVGEGSGGGGGASGCFTVQWTSSEALEKELKQREQARLEDERRLIERLEGVEAKAKTVVALRLEAASLLRRQRAARAIQRAYRLMRRRRREERRRRRKEAEARERERKLKLQEKIAARNEVRKRRLMDEWRGAVVESKVVEKEEERVEMRDWVRGEEERTNRKLQDTLARLQSERDEKLWELEGAYWSRDENERDALGASLIHAVRSLHVKK